MKILLGGGEILVLFLEDRKIQIGVAAGGVECDGLLGLCDGLGQVGGRVGFGEKNLRLGVPGIGLQDGLNVIAGVRLLSGFEQEAGQVQLGSRVAGIEFHRAREFLVSEIPLAQLQKGLGQVKVRVGILGVDLDGIGVFDGGFAVFGFLKVGVALVNIALLQNLGIARAAGERGSQDTTNGECGLEVAEIAFLTLLAPLWDYYYMRRRSGAGNFSPLVRPLRHRRHLPYHSSQAELALEGPDIRCGGTKGKGLPFRGRSMGQFMSVPRREKPRGLLLGF